MSDEITKENVTDLVIVSEVLTRHQVNIIVKALDDKRDAYRRTIKRNPFSSERERLWQDQLMYEELLRIFRAVRDSPSLSIFKLKVPEHPVDREHTKYKT